MDEVSPLDENGKKQSKKKKSGKEEKPEDPAVAATQQIIDEINAASAKNKAEREKGKEKSIDEIVENASAEKEKTQTDEKFEVTKEQMKASVEDYTIPPVSLLNTAKHASTKDISGELKSNAQRLIETLHSFNVDATITDISRGPTVTRYELKPAAGIRISKITNLADDIALNLAATHVRIEAPIPGKAAVGIEVPNAVKNMVSMRSFLSSVPSFPPVSERILPETVFTVIFPKCRIC